MKTTMIKDNNIGREITHPGEILRRDYLEPLSLSVSKLARHLNVSRIIVSRIVNKHSPITADMALRLSIVFDTTPEFWLGLQQQYDLYRAKLNDSWKNAKVLNYK